MAGRAGRNPQSRRPSERHKQQRPKFYYSNDSYPLLLLVSKHELSLDYLFLWYPANGVSLFGALFYRL